MLFKRRHDTQHNGILPYDIQDNDTQQTIQKRDTQHNIRNCYAVCHYAECRCAEFQLFRMSHYAKCHYAECRGAHTRTFFRNRLI